MNLSPQTERAIELCYDSIAAPQLWTGALDNLAHSLGAAACVIQPHELSQRPFGQVRSSHAWRIRERWLKNLDWVKPVYEPRGDHLVRQGYRAVLQSQLFSDEEIRHSRFHQEITRPVGCLHWACGIFQVEDRIWCLPFFRGSEPFDRRNTWNLLPKLQGGWRGSSASLRKSRGQARRMKSLRWKTPDVRRCSLTGMDA